MKLARIYYNDIVDFGSRTGGLANAQKHQIGALFIIVQYSLLAKDLESLRSQHLRHSSDQNIAVKTLRAFYRM